MCRPLIIENELLGGYVTLCRCRYHHFILYSQYSGLAERTVLNMKHCDDIDNYTEQSELLCDLIACFMTSLLCSFL